jgi:DNA-binding LacI/PurR family transcriptional regulator
MELKINKQTISDQIVEHFKGLIEAGEYKPGDAFPSERQLEKQLGISRKTINKAISILAGQGYLFKEQGKATFVADFRKKADIAPAQDNIGFVFKSPDCVYHPATAPLFRTLCELTGAENLGIKLFFDDRKEYEGLQKAIATSEIKGLFVFEVNETPSLKAQLASLKIPFTAFNNQIFKNLDNPFFTRVYADTSEAVKQAVELLASQGHKNIGFLYGVNGWLEDDERIEAFKQAMEECGCPVSPDMILPSSYDQKETIKNTKKIISHSSTAIIGADDMVARWVIEYLTEQEGLNIPKDISVIGFNDMEMYSRRSPELTTFTRPSKEVAQLAVKSILTPDGAKNIPVKFKLAERETTSPIN